VISKRPTTMRYFIKSWMTQHIQISNPTYAVHWGQEKNSNGNPPPHIPRPVTLCHPAFYPICSPICWRRSVTKLNSSVKDKRFWLVHIRSDGLERSKTLDRMRKPRSSSPRSFSMTSVHRASSTASKIWTVGLVGYERSGRPTSQHFVQCFS
jgi:hypothetical protein